MMWLNKRRDHCAEIYHITSAFLLSMSLIGLWLILSRHFVRSSGRTVYTCPKFTKEIIEAAIVGFEAQKQNIDTVSSGIAASA